MKLILALITLLSLVLISRFYFFFKTIPSYQAGEKVRFEFPLMEEPKVDSRSQSFYYQGIKIYAPLEPRLGYGDAVIVNGKIEEKSFTSKQNGQVITQKLLQYPHLEIAGKNSFLTAIQAIRERVKQTFSLALTHKESGLLLGIVFGFKDGIDNDFYNELKNTGVLHVVTASGTNVSMFSAFILSACLLIFSRRRALVAACTGIIFYAFLSGLEPSIIRASLMAVLSYTALIFGRQAYSLLILFIVACLMLIFDPGLILDVGFQLSFLSTLGILLVKPLFDVFFSVKKWILSDDFSTTLAAQTGSLPVLFASFSSYSLISVLVNGLILWTIPVLMILGGAAALASFINPILSMPFLYLAYPFLWFFEAIVSLGDRFSMVLKMEYVSSFWVLGYYLLLGSIVLLFKKK